VGPVGRRGDAADPGLLRLHPRRRRAGPLHGRRQRSGRPPPRACPGLARAMAEVAAEQRPESEPMATRADRRWIGAAMVLAAAGLWGTLGIMARVLYLVGVTPA